jgi:hypothetical protein
MSNTEAFYAYFLNSKRDHITETLDFLQDIVDAITALFLNGTRPELGKRDYKEHNQRIRDGAASVLRSLYLG